VNGTATASDLARLWRKQSRVKRLGAIVRGRRDVVEWVVLRSGRKGYYCIASAPGYAVALKQITRYKLLNHYEKV